MPGCASQLPQVGTLPCNGADDDCLQQSCAQGLAVWGMTETRQRPRTRWLQKLMRSWLNYLTNPGKLVLGLACLGFVHETWNRQATSEKEGSGQVPGMGWAGWLSTPATRIIPRHEAVVSSGCKASVTLPVLGRNSSGSSNGPPSAIWRRPLRWQPVTCKSLTHEFVLACTCVLYVTVLPALQLQAESQAPDSLAIEDQGAASNTSLPLALNCLRSSWGTPCPSVNLQYR